MDAAEAQAYLDTHLNREAVAGRIDGLSLDPVTALLDVLGDPHHAYPVIHLTGTNGKGSTAAVISALLEAQGLNVGLYTSPHYERINERIARNRRPLDDGELGLAIGLVAAAEGITGYRPSYFEILTAAAFAWFADAAVDVAVVEVGLLGAHDATNVVSADIAVVTSVGLDHTDGTPGWRRAIAEEKAGIIDPGTHLILGPVGDDVEDIFLDRPARDRWVFGRDLVLDDDAPADGGRELTVVTPYGEHEDLLLPLHGAHQAVNATLAVGAAEAFFGRALEPETLRPTLAGIELPGRVEVVRTEPTIVLDGAHNPDGVRALARTLRDLGRFDRRLVVFGALGERDPEELLAGLELDDGDLVFACEPDSPRALPAAEIAAAAAAQGLAVEIVPDPVAATDRAVDEARPGDLVLVTGSIYVVGAVRAAGYRTLSTEEPGTNHEE